VGSRVPAGRHGVDLIIESKGGVTGVEVTLSGAMDDRDVTP
jgi:hypothetical protein